MAITDILSSATSIKSSLSSGGTVGAISTGATVGSIVPGVGTVVGGIVGGATSIFSKIFGGGSGPKDPTGDGGVANATAINQQRDTILGSEIWRYYASLGKFPTFAGPGATWLDAPAVDAFGSAAGALAKIADAIEQLKVLIKSEPLVQKHMDAINRVYTQDSRGVFGPMTGSGNVPNAISNLNGVLRIVNEAELKEQSAIQQTQALLVTPADNSTPGNVGSASTNDITSLALLLQQGQTSQLQFLTSFLTPLLNRQQATTEVTAPPAPAPVSSPLATAMAGFDFASLKTLAPAILTLMIVGFIFSNLTFGGAKFSAK